MPVDSSMWGPELNQYSRTFNPHLLPDMSNKDIENFFDKYQVLPLTSIQNSLCRADPRTDILGFTGVKLGHMVGMLRSYMVASRQSNVFKYYYGFLCVRNLVHITCLGVLGGADTLNNLVGSLQPNASWSTMSQAVAFAALDKTVSATTSSSSLEQFCKTSCFVLDGTAGKADTSMLARMLWDSRDSFLTLCLRGLLPGCALLLLAITRLLSTGPEEERLRGRVLYLRDLGLRLYLAGSRRDRQVLPHVCLLTKEKGIASTVMESFVSSEDSHTMTRAYSGLLVLWQQDKSSIKLVSISLLADLTDLVLNSFRLDPSVAIQDLMEITFVALLFLWLFVEQRGQMNAAEHSEMIQYFSLHFLHVRLILIKGLTTQDERYKFAQLVANSQITSLAGRVLLSAITQKNGFHREEWFKPTLQELVGLSAIFAAATSAAPELFEISRMEWSKVATHAEFLVDMNLVGLKSGDGRAAYHRSSMLKLWAQYGNYLGYEAPPEVCSYSRCFSPVTRKNTLEVRHMCGQCKSAVYCDVKCQRAHWNLATSESHKLVCDPPCDTGLA